MPTIPELIASTQAKIATNEQTIVTLKAAIETRAAQLALAEARRSVLRLRLEALQVLATEPE
jgi:hypothetical protein